MKKWLLVILLFLAACGNKVDTRVPEHITTDVKVSDSVQTVNVIHTIGLSLQMESFFRASCTQQVDTATPGMPEPQRTQSIDLCVSVSSQKFIEDFMLLIKQGMAQNGQSTGGK